MALFIGLHFEFFLEEKRHFLRVVWSSSRSFSRTSSRKEEALEKSVHPHDAVACVFRMNVRRGDGRVHHLRKGEVFKGAHAGKYNGLGESGSIGRIVSAFAVRRNEVCTTHCRKDN